MLHPEAFVALPCVGWGALIQGPITGLVLILVAFLSILAHEMGHAFAARRFALRVECLHHMGFVGLCVFEDSGPNPKARCLIAAAGPIVNLGVAGLCLPFAMMSGANGPREPIAVSIVVSIVVMNAIMCVGNLLPAFPLDTGSTADALLTDLLAGHKRRNAQRRPTS